MAPTFETLQTDNGVVYRVTYAGMTRYHQQLWQALVYYEMALSLYGRTQLKAAQ